MSSTAKDGAVKAKLNYLVRFAGEAAHEGVGHHAIIEHLERDGVKDGLSIVATAMGRKTLPRLGEGELKALGGRDGFRALFGLPPADVQLESAPPVEFAKPMALDEAHKVFRKWFGDEYDMAAFDATCAAAAMTYYDGDPLWLLVISGSGFAKTETVQAAEAPDAIVVSAISSVGALLSGTSKKEQGKEATGGLLKTLGSLGILIVKDFTTILSMSREAQPQVLAAFREIYDGYWRRDMGVDGGKHLEWKGRVSMIGAVTSVWDKHHSVVASMGDRYVLLRVNSADAKARKSAGQQSLDNLGNEAVMRAELKAAMGGVIVGRREPPALTSDDHARLLPIADVVTLCRTPCEYDYKGDVVSAHQPEGPTRFLKQIAQALRGGMAIGLSHDDAMKLAVRLAGDSMPPLRLRILQALAQLQRGTTKMIADALDQPWQAVDKQLQSLHALTALSRTSQASGKKADQSTRYAWAYQLNLTMPDDLKSHVVLQPSLCPTDDDDIPF
jgi:hypothetical protein